MSSPYELIGLSKAEVDKMMRAENKRRKDAGASPTDWFPTSRQEEVLRTRAKEMLFGGARGGGKTEAGIIFVADPAARLKIPRFRGLVLRETAADLADWCDRAEEVLAPTGARRVGNPPTFVWPWGSKVFSGHLKDSRSIAKYVGREFQRVVIEELTQIKDNELYLKLLASARSTIPGLTCRFLLTTNPGGPGHYWVKERFIDVAAPGVFYKDPTTGLHRVFIKSKVTDNPYILKHDPAYVATLMGLPEKVRKAWLDGDWDIMEGQYFPEFADGIHVIRPQERPLQDHWVRYRAMDGGFFPDPCVCLWIASPTKGPDIIYREKHWFRTLPEDVAADIRRLSELDKKISYTVADPAMWQAKSGPSDAERLISSGVPLIQADNSRVQGWMRVHEALAYGEDLEPGLQIYDTCINTIASIPSLVHDERNPMDAAPHKLDHWADAVRYYVMSRPVRTRQATKIAGPLSLKAMRYRLRKQQEEAT